MTGLKSEKQLLKKFFNGLDSKGIAESEEKNFKNYWFYALKQNVQHIYDLHYFSPFLDHYRTQKWQKPLQELVNYHRFDNKK